MEHSHHTHPIQRHADPTQTRLHQSIPQIKCSPCWIHTLNGFQTDQPIQHSSSLQIITNEQINSLSALLINFDITAYLKVLCKYRNMYMHIPSITRLSAEPTVDLVETAVFTEMRFKRLFLRVLLVTDTALKRFHCIVAPPVDRQTCSSLTLKAAQITDKILLRCVDKLMHLKMKNYAKT